MKEKYKCIYNMRLAGYLMQHGYPIRKIVPNKHCQKWDVYMFDQSDEIEEIIKFYNYKKSKGNSNYDINRKNINKIRNEIN